MPQYSDFWQMELEPQDFTKLLTGPLSYRAVYKPASLCPCFDPTRGSPDPDCPVCNGVGYTWTEPAAVAHTLAFYRGSQSRPERLEHAPPITDLTITGEDSADYTAAAVITEDGRITWPDAQTAPPFSLAYSVTYKAPAQVRVHAQAFKSNRSWVDRGEVKAGDLDTTIPHTLADLTTENPAWHAKEFDIFVFPDQRIRHQQRMRRGYGETLTYKLVRSLREARAIAGSTIATYQPGTDFEVVNGAVSWLTAGPADHYVLEYDAAPEAYVFAELPQTRHVDGHPLPRRVGLRRFELFPHRR